MHGGIHAPCIHVWSHSYRQHPTTLVWMVGCLSGWMSVCIHPLIYPCLVSGEACTEPCMQSLTRVTLHQSIHVPIHACMNQFTHSLVGWMDACRHACSHRSLHDCSPVWMDGCIWHIVLECTHASVSGYLLAFLVARMCAISNATMHTSKMHARYHACSGSSLSRWMNASVHSWMDSASMPDAMAA
jgi:hypothetical protein